MSGHSKWANIKNKKEKTDSQRGKIFTKIGREIAIAVKEGGSDPNNNSKLRDVIAKAKAANVPNDNITRSIKKAAGELGSINYEEITYEGYGPSGTAFLIEVATDNTNRSASELRTLFTKNGGSIGTPGSVAYQFERKGEARIMAEGLTEDSAMDLALECGADDVEQGDSDNEWVFVTSPTELNNVCAALREAGHTVISMKLISVAQNASVINDLETAKAALRLYEALDDYDDALNVFSNFDVAEEILEQLG